MAGSETQLVRGLNLRDATALVIGTIIGTGVFLKAAVMAQAVGSPGWVLLAWVVAGLLSLAGALTYAELGAMMPHAGGEYVYLRAAYGELPAFLFGWMRMLVASSGSIAAFGAAFASFLAGLLSAQPALAAAYNQVWAEAEVGFLGQTIHWRFGPPQVVAVGLILVLSGLNCLRVVVGGLVQTVLTAAKLVGIGLIVVGVFLFAAEGTWANLRGPAGASAWPGLSAFGAALVAALWAYDGWNNMPMVAGEVKQPERNIPRALILGMLVVLAVYGLINLAYHYALPVEALAGARSTAHPDALPAAALAAETFLGRYGPALVSVIFLVSALGTLNGSILTNARVPFAMARAGFFFPVIGRLHPRTAVPVAAIVLQAVWSSVLAVSGSFDQLTDYVVFASWIFYAATTASVFVLRRKLPGAARPYRTLGYPVVPALFVVVAGWLLVNTLHTHRVESALGLGIIALGLPVYWWQRRAKAQANGAASGGSL
ncbi:MAG: amino acid permease [Verrucomicrobiae bacterium]|nr:amino acid permease [Verrucomicrobiae bacterium]